MSNWKFVLRVKPTATWGEVVATTNILQDAYNVNIHLENNVLVIDKIDNVRLDEFLTDIDDDTIKGIEFVTKPHGIDKL